MAILVVAVLSGCEKDSKDTFLSVENMELKFSSKGSSETLRVNSDTDWSIMDAPDWLEFSAIRGDNSQDVVVTAKANLTGVLREAQFVVRTNNGSQQQIVKARQSGDGDVDKFNVPDVSKRWLNGDNSTIGFKDSIYIDANMAWTIEGPDWLTAEFKNHPILSLKGDVQKSGSGYLVIYPIGENYEYPDREGEVRISSPYSSQVFTIPVAQLGYGRVVPINPLLMAHGYATSFKYGREVSYIVYQIFEGHASDSETTSANAAANWHFGYVNEDYYTSFSDCKPNTQYELCFWTVSDDYYLLIDGLNRYTITTPTDLNQPICEIRNVGYSEKKLTWEEIMNPYTTAYYSFYSLIMDFDEIQLAYLTRNIMNSEKFELFTQNSSNTINNLATDILLYTWAVGADQKLSNVLTLYPFMIDGSEKVMRRSPLGRTGNIREDAKNIQVSKKIYTK